MPAGPPPTMQHFVVSVFAFMRPPTRSKLWTFPLRVAVTLHTGVVAGLVPATASVEAQSKINRGGRDKPGHDRG